MKKADVFSALRVVLIILGALTTLDALLLIVLANIHIGHFLALGVGASLILFGTFFKKLPVWIKIVYIPLAAIAIISGSALLIYGNNDTAFYNEDALIVLGAGIRGETPTAVLRGRLDAAVNYHKSNPEAVIVVSGGRGPQEDITEARAMQKYLTENGVPAEKIILEEEATSSYENFLFSKGLLDLYLGDNYTVAFITNDYHIYRAELTAQKAGFAGATHLHSGTPAYMIIPNILREYLAVAKALILN